VTRRAVVAVVGPGDTDDDTLLDGARRIGAGLAKAGATIVTGGLGGVMAAAAQGAKDENGLVVGILPGDDAGAANPWLDVALPTGLGEARNSIVARSAHVMVAVGGSWGTLSEIAIARRGGTPVVSWRGWRVDGAPVDDVTYVATPDEAIRAAVSLLSATQP
jgi:uncharacterized protein (TIGR00725 family)